MAKSSVKFKVLEHTADIKFRVIGKSLEEVFENSIIAVSSCISRGGKISSTKRKAFKISGEDEKEMWYKLIDEIVYLLDAKHFVVSKGKVKVNGEKLEAEVWGDYSRNYEDLDHIKAATYAEMKIERRGNNWVGEFVVDV